MGSSAAPAPTRNEARVVGKQRLGLTNLDKVMFPESGSTKGDLLKYYEAIAPLMLPHLRDRPLTLRGFPQGLGGPRFWTKEVKPHHPKFLTRSRVEFGDGRVIDNFMVNNIETLVELANMNIIEFHIWGARRDRLRRPDRVVFDLDPHAGASFAMVREGARIFRAALAAAGLETMPLATGSRGLHVVFYLQRHYDFQHVADWAETFAKEMARLHPALFTSEMRKAKRGDRVFVDWLRNQFAQTAVCPYSVRARDKPAVAVPLTWHEVESGKVKAGMPGPRSLASNLWTIADYPALLERGDVWCDFPKLLQFLPKQ